ncbi:MAG: SOS response-associated peptidase [Leptospirales bacterium]|nr:SOS response-associated peptidase [Leptospirales bacterium]
MCGRFALLLSPDQLARQFDLPLLEDLIPRYNIAPGQEIAVVRSLADGKRILSSMLWGLIPAWARNRAESARLINARLETASQKPSFREAFLRHRALIPASGFYEWQTAASGPVKSGKNAKQPYYIDRQDGATMALAALWTPSPENDEQAGSGTCAILTRAASTAMQSIHERMPLILPPESWSAWLDPALQSEAEIASLSQTALEDGFRFRAISRLINKASFDDAAVLAPVDAAASEAN